MGASEEVIAKAYERAEQLANAWSKLLEINLKKPVEVCGLLPHVVELVMVADVKPHLWDDLAKKASSGDLDAQSAVYYGAATAVHQANSIPDSLKPFAVDCLLKKAVARNKRRGRGGSRYTNAYRDGFITRTLYQLREEFGIPPTRSEASAEISGSETVANVLKRRGYNRRGHTLDKRGVEEVWGKREKCWKA
jgi:hypothetical protein